MLEKIGDPLVHLVRNSIDHGIETPEERVAAGKPAPATVHLERLSQGGNIVVEVSDDGGGLQRERILAKARERGLVGPNEDARPTSRSTTSSSCPASPPPTQITDVSGRGVGMDVVRRNIKALGGNIESHRRRQGRASSSRCR